MKKFLIILLLISTQFAFSQGEANIWAFGAGLDFNSSPPKLLQNQNLRSGGGRGASICTAHGKLFLYAGLENSVIWDSTHQTMSNSVYVYGKMPIIIPKPEDSKIFYVFWVATTTGFLYSEVDMTLNYGRGDVVSGKNGIMLSNVQGNKIAGVRHDNGKDYWVLNVKTGTDTVYAWQVTSSGIKNPVKSNIGTTIDNGSYNQMKISPDGTRIGFARLNSSYSVIADFNASTGKITNPWYFNEGAAWGLEFSPNSNYMYMSIITDGSQKKGKVVQFDAKAVSSSAFLASKKLVDDSYPDIIGDLQLAPDGKIYLAQGVSSSESEYLHVINYPDLAGSKCSPQKKYCIGNAGYKFPTFISSYFRKVSFEVFNRCANAITSFSITDNVTPDSVNWNFGDTISGSNNFSNKIKNANHNYNKGGEYTVKLTYYIGNKIVVSYSVISIINPDKPYIGRDTNICEGNSLILSSNKSYKSYNWNNSISAKTMTISQPGKYILTISDSVGCKSADTILISQPTFHKPNLGRDTTLCNSFTLKLSPQKNYLSYEWSNGIKTKILNVNERGTYSLNVLDSFGCSKADTIVIKNPIISADFSISDFIQCFKSNAFEFKVANSYQDANKKQTTFYFFDGNSNDSIIKRSFPNEGKYSVMIIAESMEGCKDSKIKTVEVRPRSITDFKVTDVCESDSVIFINQSQNAEAYKWKFGDGEHSAGISPKHLFKIGGITKTFNVTLVSILSGDCSDSITNAVTVSANPKSDFSYIINNNEWIFTPTQSGNSKYRWLFGDQDSAISENANHTYKDNKSAHIVCLKSTNAATCISETCKLIATTSISFIKALGFKIYPNPNNGNFTIEIDNQGKDIYIQVYDFMGKLIKSVLPNTTLIPIDLNVAEGIYMVKLTNGTNTYCQKVTVKR